MQKCGCSWPFHLPVRRARRYNLGRMAQIVSLNWSAVKSLTNKHFFTDKSSFSPLEGWTQRHTIWSQKFGLSTDRAWNSGRHMENSFVNWVHQAQSIAASRVSSYPHNMVLDQLFLLFAMLCVGQTMYVAYKPLHTVLQYHFSSQAEIVS